MSCPQVRTPVFPSGGKPGLILYGTSSPHKRLIQQEDDDEIMRKRARPTQESPLLHSRTASDSSLVLPDTGSSHVEFPYQTPQTHRAIQGNPSPHSGINLGIKYEADCFASRNALTFSGDSLVPPDHMSNSKWASGDESYISQLSNLEPQSSASPSDSFPSKSFFQADSSSSYQVYQNDPSIVSAFWSTDFDRSQTQDWPSEPTQVVGWSAMTQVDQLQYSNYTQLYSNPGPAVSCTFSEQDLTLPESSPNIYDHFTESLNTKNTHLQLGHHLRKSSSTQSLQEARLVSSASQPSNDFFSPHNVRTYLESMGVHYECLDESSPSSPLQQWPEQGPLNEAFTLDPLQQATFVPQGPLFPPQWDHGPISIPTHLKNGIQDGQSNPVATTIKSETHPEEVKGNVIQPTGAMTPYDRATIDVQATFDNQQEPPNFYGLPSHPQPLDPEPKWLIHPDHDPDLLYVCQSSRQKPQTVANGTSDTTFKPRKPFREEERQETSRTRDIGACVRCKMQRVRCRPNPVNPDGPCIPCLKVASNPSKKVIHHIGCHRYRLQEITIFRTSPTPVNAKRWQTAQVRDVITHGEPMFVKLKQHFGRPFVIRVSAFAPLKDDETTRAGRDPSTGDEYNEPLGLFALKRAHDVIDDYRTYIKDNWYREFATKCARPGDPNSEAERIVAEVYNWGLRHFDCLPQGPSWDLYRSSTDWDPKKVSQRSFMQGTLMMCFVLRQALGQSWIDPEDLDPEQWPRHEKFTPLKGLPGTPRMIVSQLDCIRISCVLRPLAKPLLKVLTTWIAERRHNCWLSIFYASFIFLREIALATEDAYVHGRRKKTYDPKNPKPNHHSIIAEMHESANVVLAHWHYFNCSINLETLDEAARGKSPLKELTPEQFQTVRGLWVRMRLWKAGRSQGSNSDGNRPSLFANSMDFKWCHPLYFASQMFESSWSPLEVFTA